MSIITGLHDAAKTVLTAPCTVFSTSSSFRGDGRAVCVFGSVPSPPAHLENTCCRFTDTTLSPDVMER